MPNETETNETAAPGGRFSAPNGPRVVRAGKTRARAAVGRESAAARRGRGPKKPRAARLRAYTLVWGGGLVRIVAPPSRRITRARARLGAWARAQASARRCGAGVCVCAGECGRLYRQAVGAARTLGVPEPRMYPSRFADKVSAWIGERE
jgi:hypothetical protein